MLPITLLTLSLLTVASAQIAGDFAPPRGACCLPGAAQALANQLQDWNQLSRYHADNQALIAQPSVAGRVVFMGDSIFDGWRLAEQFPGKPYVNRGIGGQTTPQMLVRMFPDVINLKPAAMIVLAATNDIARNTGPTTLAMIEQNLQAMTELAQIHGIKVILCSVTPISDHGRRPMSTGRPPADILKINAWMKDYAARAGAIYADYFSVMVDDKGLLKEGFSEDGLHPNAKGYALMAPVTVSAIEQALR